MQKIIVIGKDELDIFVLEALRYKNRDLKITTLPMAVVSGTSRFIGIKPGCEAGASSYLTTIITDLNLKEAIEKVPRG